MKTEKDWSGNRKSVYVTVGSSNHSLGVRACDDFYATDPRAVEMLLQLENFNESIWECACGEGHISRVLAANDYKVKSTDLVDRGYGSTGVDFLVCNEKWNGDIITNPPYRHALDFIRKSLDLVEQGGKVAMLLRLQFLEGKSRKQFYATNPVARVWVSSSRLVCAKNGDFQAAKSFSAMCFAWFVWEKGYRGDTVLKWFN